MVNSTVIIDAGPLVALTNERDQYHAWARQESVKLKAPFITCDAVLSEAWFLLRALPKAQEKMLSLMQKGLIQSQFNSAPETVTLTELLRKYADVPMSFADASLVRMSELVQGYGRPPRMRWPIHSPPTPNPDARLTACSAALLGKDCD